MSKLLEIKDLQVHFSSETGIVKAVDGISFDLFSGETIGIVGESGSGKSVTSLSVMRLLPQPPAKFAGGEINFFDEKFPKKNLLKFSEKEIQKIRGSEIAMIFQEPMSSLNPVFRCGNQVTEAIQLHQKINFESAKKQTLALFEKVKLPEPERIFQAYPHQISGGQKQRVMIAMAISCQPKILIADEPTTALDVTVQKTILDLLRDLQKREGLSMIFISHDLGVISEIADRVVVMFQGKIVEMGTVAEIFSNPKHPYTKGLVACRPSLSQKLYRLPTVPDFLENTNFESRVITKQETAARQEQLLKNEKLLDVKNLEVRFPKKKNWFGQPTDWTKAVDDVSFEIFQGESFGLAGESGCGKTTLGKAIAKLIPAHAGQVFYKKSEISGLKESGMRPLRREIQVIFQDPFASLNPRMTIGEAILEPMNVHKIHPNPAARKEKTVELLETVGLYANHFERYPHEFSGGQRQRICIARALALEPKFLICDEIVSALDVSVQATVLNLLAELQEKFGLTYLFISHDLSVIHQFCDRLMVMNQGKTEEIGFPEDILFSPKTGYVKKLVEAIPGKI